MLTDEQKARLNPEQLAIAEKWEREREERDKLWKILISAQENKDQKLWEETLDSLQECAPSQCEHERSIWSPCVACDEIERLLNPEFYDENGDRLEDEEIEKLINERGS